MSDVMGLLVIAGIVAVAAAVLFLNIFRKSALYLLLLSIHSPRCHRFDSSSLRCSRQ
ncbi:hypothetical protein M4D81_25865 [Paenibacillus sp. p3-SID867]|uniref:hypothetical protein n=1 Tax=Paenibacillus sp. p3-SID867 TaxID=2916363 RepID=UPI0021A2B646|nr:hypothetical protein [Paenibacillus sp. p3-SID867]MCT1402421.1 hypothetical protein [Paenibacillus sp. p3-SID867]